MNTIKLQRFVKIFVNLLTISRFIFILFLFKVFSSLSSWVFLVIISFLFFTDFLDGVLARKFKVQSYFGSYMDTIADKTLSLGLMLFILNEVVPLWFVFIMELLIALINLIGVFSGKRTQSSIGGKLKMWFLSFSVILSYFYYFKIIDINYVWISCIFTFLLQMYVCINYIIFLIKQKSGERKVFIKGKSIKYCLFDTDYFLNNN